MIKDILYENDFFLPIRQITLTDDSLILANNKRIILYDYRKDIDQTKNQSHYLKMYEQTEENDSIRYL